MIFKKGSKFKTPSKMEVPSDKWYSAKKFLSDGDEYSVQHDCLPGMQAEETVVTVPKKVIRHCPQLVNSVENLEAGDVVEVFIDFSWKVATVLKAMGGKYYLVRLFGSSRELQIHKVNTRVYQLWEGDGGGAVIGRCSDHKVVKFDKVSSTTNFLNMGCSLPQAITRLEVGTADNSVDVQNKSSFRASRFGAAGKLKRSSPFLSSNEQACNGNAQKLRAVEKEGVCLRVKLGYPRSTEKVDAVTNTCETLAEGFLCSFNNNGTTGQCAREMGKTNSLVNCFSERYPEANASDTDACSVGSCSVVSSSESNFFSCFVAGLRQDADSVSSDADSFYDCGNEKEIGPLPLGGDVSARIRSLELNAYHRTLVALYASGPLSWEQEALLTNLRLSLHISNDEHLMEIRNLISARKTSIHIR